MLKFSESFEFSRENSWILKDFEWFEWFEWFGPSPIEPFNLGLGPPACMGQGERRGRGKASLRSEVNIELNFPPKLRGARSLLYRRQILQVYTRWKALDEIYKISMLLHRSDLNISEIFRQFFSHFLAKFCKNSSFLNSFHWFLLRFWWNLVGISPII